jgi:Arc/MetJ-type ribon-helix-helix transcriptional regulator
MTLSLSPEITRLIDERVKSGKYQSAEDVVAAAVANLAQQEGVTQLPPSQLEVLFPGIATQIKKGLDDARAGRLSDGDAFFAELEQEDKGE